MGITKNPVTGGTIVTANDDGSPTVIEGVHSASSDFVEQPVQITLDRATIEQLQAAAFRAIVARDAAQAELNSIVAELNKRAQGG